LSPTLVSWLQTDRYLLTLQEDEDDEDGDKESKPLPTRTQIITRAVLYLIAGAAIAAIFSDPLVDAIGGFSKASGIPPFFIAFIATPLATNSSEAISSILFARGKRKRNISMTYSQVCCVFPGNRHLDQSESQPTI
jgi:Ca2+/Na+ antiporter